MEGENTQHTPTTATTAQGYAIPFAIVIAGVAIACAIYFGNIKSTAIAPVVADGTLGAPSVEPISSDDHILGNPNAKVVIVEYSDTECPFCKSFHPMMQRIMGEYGKGGQVAWVYRHFPLSYHTNSPKEAEATECANKLGGNTKFWEYINKVFEITPGNNGLDAAELPKIASTVGLNTDAFNKCLSSGEMKAVVDADITSGTKAGVSGTPYPIIMVNKKPVTLVNSASYESVKSQIDAFLK